MAEHGELSPEELAQVRAFLEKPKPETTDDADKPKTTDDEDEGEGSFTAYWKYNQVLRTWFVAFGIGGPALFLVNENVGDRLAKADCLRGVAILFLVGVVSQVLGAFINKIANWYVYLGIIDKEEDEENKKEKKEENFSETCRYKSSEWFTSHIWPDIMLDLITIGCFGLAAFKILHVFCG